MRRFKTDALAGFIICHALAALACLPWFFSWAGVALLGVGIFVFGVLGPISGSIGSLRIAVSRAHAGLSAPLRCWGHVLCSFHRLCG
jgi:hypothetical protein